MNRLPNTQNESARTTLTSIRQQLDALKQPQVSNGYNVTIHLNQTGNAFDHGPISIPAYSTETVEVDFTSSQQSYALCDITVRMFQDTLTHEVDFMTNAGQQSIFRFLATANPTVWLVKAYNNDSVAHTYWLKYTVQSTDTGTIQPL